MGILSVIDTLLVYKIAEYRYNRNVAFIAAVLFAVVPVGWILRRVLLDAILLPFILCSILFALNIRKSEGINKSHSQAGLNNLAIFISGIFLGLAIFVKVPALALIPFFLFVIYIGTKSRKAPLLWSVPVILIPMIWPIFAMSIGHADSWLDGVTWQAERLGRSLSNELKHLFTMDPLLTSFSLLGIGYAWIRRDYFLVIWTVPYLILLFVVDWVYFFHLIPVLPAFCIGGARLISDVTRKGTRHLKESTVVVCSLLIFVATLSSIAIVSNDLNTSYFKIVTLVGNLLPNITHNEVGGPSYENATLIAPNGGWGFSWIYKYVLEKDFAFEWFQHDNNQMNRLNSSNVVLVVDKDMRSAMFSGENNKYLNLTSSIYEDSNPLDKFYGKIRGYKPYHYPYSNYIDDVDERREVNRTRGLDWTGEIEVRTSYWPS
jgi:4-amino-4-deoxy-L-arabinose transferase-like glycosyltransferase